MALLRRLDVPCRVHAFRLDKRVQHGIVPDLFYGLTPRTLLHTCAEIEHDGRWVGLEGCILDQDYLSALQSAWTGCEGGLCGYGVAVADVQNPPVEWRGKDTFIQFDSVVEDLGVFESPRRAVSEA